MTREEALKIALDNFETHKMATKYCSGILAFGEQNRAEICQMIIDVFEGRTPTGNIKEALAVLYREKEKYARELAYSLAETVYPTYIEKYKRCVDWYTCCIEALDDYLYEYGSEE
jgi:hypothetical protein